MKKLRNLGLSGIIASSLIGCVTINSIKNIDLHKTRYTSEIISKSLESNRDRMLFVPNKMYKLEECLVGNYHIIALKGDSIHTRLLVQYFNHKSEMYQQALFGRDLNDTHQKNVMKISVVEIDWDRDGKQDMRMSLERTITYDQYNNQIITEKLKLLDFPNVPMTNYCAPTTKKMYVASTEDE